VTIVPLTARYEKCDLASPVDDFCFLCPRCGSATSVAFMPLMSILALVGIINGRWWPTPASATWASWCWASSP